MVTFPWSVAAGGGQYSAIYAANALARRGHTVSYCSDVGPALEKLDKAVRFHRAPASLTFLRSRLFPFWPASVFRFLQAVVSSKPDLIHAYCAPSFVLGCMARVIFGTPCLFTDLGPVVPPQDVCRLAGTMVVCSEELKEKLVAQYGLDKERIIVIPNHMDLGVYRPGLDPTGLATRLNLSPDVRRIVVLGRVTPSKYGTISSVLAAVPEVLRVVPGLEVVIVGTGESIIQAEQEAEVLNRQAGRRVVRLTGALLEVPLILNLAEIVVGIGRSALEGMACQKPTLIIGQNGYAGTVCPEMAQELAHFNFAGRNLTRPADPQRVVQEIIRLLADHGYADSVARFGRKYVEEHVDADKDVIRLEQMYSQALTQRADRLSQRLQLVLPLTKMLLSRLFILPRLLAKLRTLVLTRNRRSGPEQASLRPIEIESPK